MSGTRTGGLKSAAKNKEKYGPDFYRNIGRKGGSVTGTQGGFAYGDNAKKFGRKGGMLSRRGFTLLRVEDGYGIYRSKETGELSKIKLEDK